MLERWGIKGDDWQQIRRIPRGELVARAWACSISGGQSREPITLHRDNGGGWVQVDRYVGGRNEEFRAMELRGGDQ